ncbi:MAG: SRPBCC family protein [Actinomycetota bacterium]|nr:SRPBCC family protein [Actinomycetota bacterium]MDH5312292.1 SRPBCC family protein [Actinomycetota bacterium]
MEGLDERQRVGGMTTVEFSVEVDAPPETVWAIASDPRNLPQWDKHVMHVDLPEDGVRLGARYDVVMGLMGVQTTVHATVLEWEPPWRSSVRLEGLLEATVTTTVGTLPFERSMLRHEVTYRFRGPLGGFGAAGLNAMGGAQYALRHGVLAQKREIEDRVSG